MQLQKLLCSQSWSKETLEMARTAKAIIEIKPCQLLVTVTTEFVKIMMTKVLTASKHYQPSWKEVLLQILFVELEEQIKVYIRFCWMPNIEKQMQTSMNEPLHTF